MKHLKASVLVLFLMGCEQKQLSQEQIKTKRDFIFKCVELAQGSKHSVEQCRMTSHQVLGY